MHRRSGSWGSYVVSVPLYRHSSGYSRVSGSWGSYVVSVPYIANHAEDKVMMVRGVAMWSRYQEIDAILP